jgi:ketosteroid isomerase-like protein
MKLGSVVGLSLMVFALTSASARDRDGTAAEAPTEKEIIAQVIDDSIGWFEEKDFDLLFSVFADDAELFFFQPTSDATIHGIEAFRKLSTIWRDPANHYLRHEVRDLRIRLHASGQVAWFSAILDDCGVYQGQEGCWKDTRWTGVLEKRDDRWVIVQAHFSFAADKVLEAAREKASETPPAP